MASSSFVIGNSGFTVVLKRNGRSSELNVSQVNTENLRRVFQVDPEEAWLQDDFDGSAYFPNDEGSFEGLRQFQTLIVNGVATTAPGPRYHQQSPISSLGSLPSSSSSLSSSSTPLFRSVVSSAKKAKYRLKIVKATLSWQGNKAVFKHVAAGFIEIDDLTARVDYVIKEVKKTWGEMYTVVTNDGLQLVDSEATNGLAFWKNPRRKIYAVVKDSIKGKSHSRNEPSSSISHDSDSDDEFQQRRKKSRIEGKINRLMEDVFALKESVSEVMQVSKDTKIPLALKKVLCDCFKCKICHIVPINPPVIVTKCCKTIIGCEVCVNSWYSGPDALTKACPSCRGERGYNETMVIRGIDDFLFAIKKTVRADEDESDGAPLDD